MGTIRGCLVVAAVVASARLASGTCTAAILQNTETRRCLYHLGADAGTPHTWGCWQDPNMLIEQDPAGVGSYIHLRSKWTNQCYYVWTDNKVYTYACWSINPGFHWEKLPVSGSATKHRYRHVQRNRCLEVSAAGAVLTSVCNTNNPRQVFSWSMYTQTGWVPPHSPMPQYHRPTPANDPCNPFQPNLPGRPYVRPYHLRHTCPDDGVTFAPLRPWHDPASWMGLGVPPADGTDITLPVGVNILVEQCSLKPEVYGKIRIPVGSRLIFADTAIFMKTRGILVEGEMWVGSETCRSHSPIHIEFHGLHSEFDGECWRKGICVSGTLEMHGKHYVQTWSRLAKTAEKWDTIIYLQDRVNWDKGQEVVVVTSYYNDTAPGRPSVTTEYNTNEVRRVKNVWHKAVELDAPLLYRHHGGTEYQVEVGLLSRNIVLRGDISADTMKNKYGGHVLASGEMRLEGVQAYLMGQQNKMARYPFHFHIGGVRPNNYVRDCSIYRSFYRCVTIHGVWETTVTRNVCYDVWGHGYYVEDGVEEDNVISYNLAARVHVIGHKAATGGIQTGEVFHQGPGLLQPADSTASGFYISNAHNYVYGNAASGGWSGFAFPRLPYAIGHYRPQSLGGSLSPLTMLPQNIYLGHFRPDQRTVLQFDGNTAHSTAYFWSDAGAVYVGGLLKTKTNGEMIYSSGRGDSEREPKECLDPECQDSGNSVRVFNRYTNVKVALCNQGFAHWGKRVEVENFEMYDGMKYGTILDDAIVAFGIKGRSENYVPSRFNAIRDFPAQVRGFEAYDQEAKTLLHDIDFQDMRTTGYPVNGDRRWWGDACALAGVTSVDRTKPDGIFGINHIRYTNNTYQNHFCINSDDNSGTRYFNYIDFDGYSTNRPQWGSTFGGAALQNKYDLSKWWQVEAACELEPKWHIWVCPRRLHSRIASMMVMVQANSFMRLGDFGVAMDWTNEAVGIYAGKTYLWGNDNTNKPAGNPWDRWAHMTRNANGVIGPSNMGWLMHFDDGTPNNLQLFSRAMPIGSWVIVALQYPPGTTFNIYSNHSRWDHVAGVHEWTTGCPNPVGTCTLYEPAASFEDLRDSDLDVGGTLHPDQDFTDYYYWDGTHLYVKIRSWAKPQDEFERHGGSLWSHQAWTRGTVIEANCPAMEPSQEEQNFGNVKWNMCAYSDSTGKMWTWTCWSDPAFLFYQDIIQSATPTSAQTGVGPYPHHEHETEIVRLRHKATGGCLYYYPLFVSNQVYQAPCGDNLLFRWTRYLDRKSNNYDAVYKHVYTGKCLTMTKTSTNQGLLKVGTCPSLGEAAMPFNPAFLFRCKRDVHLVPRCAKQNVVIPSRELVWDAYVPRPDYYWANNGPYEPHCSVGCGGGERCRTVVCRQGGSGAIVADSNCNGLDKLYKNTDTCVSCGAGSCDGAPCTCIPDSCAGNCVACSGWPVPISGGTCRCTHSTQCEKYPHQYCNSGGSCVAGPSLGQPCQTDGVCGEGLTCNTVCNRCVSATGDLGGNSYCLSNSECLSGNCQGESGCTAGLCTHPSLSQSHTTVCGKVVEFVALKMKSVAKIAMDSEADLHNAFEKHFNLKGEAPSSGNQQRRGDNDEFRETEEVSQLDDVARMMNEQHDSEWEGMQQGVLRPSSNPDPAVYSTKCVNRVGDKLFDTLVLGANSIECSVQLLKDPDQLGSLLVTREIRVQDTVKPTITCPPNQYVTTRGQGSTVVSLPMPYVFDAGDANPKVTNDAPKGSLFPNGRRTVVRWSAKDAAGHSATCSHTVTVATCVEDRATGARKCSPARDDDDQVVWPSFEPRKADPFRKKEPQAATPKKEVKSLPVVLPGKFPEQEQESKSIQEPTQQKRR